MRIALLSSRQARSCEPDAPWLLWTRSLATGLAADGHELCTSIGNLPYEMALYSAARAGGRVELTVRREREVEKCKRLLPDDSQALTNIRVLPPGANSGPDRDQALLASCDLAIGISVRPGGTMERLLRRRISEGGAVAVLPPSALSAASRARTAESSIRCARTASSPICRGNEALLEAGAQSLIEIVSRAASVDDFRWLADVCECMNTASSGMSATHSPQGLATVLRELELQLYDGKSAEKSMLFHFTRACDGPWPGQTRREYLEDLFLGGARGCRDIHASLTRILRTGTILGSSRLIRGKVPMVSFTALPPEKLEGLRRYRRHLIRWDFLPIGLAVERRYLESFGAKPVLYLPSHAYGTLNPAERPWFQKTEPPTCDYRAEEEWRVPGNVLLKDIPRSAIRVILPDGHLQNLPDKFSTIPCSIGKCGRS